MSGPQRLLFNNTHHLWFLYSLTHILVGVVVVTWLGESHSSPPVLGLGGQQSPNYSLLHPVLALGNGLSVAFYIVGSSGLFSRYFSNYNPRIRYLSDSAYWVYILHQSALILFAVEWPFRHPMLR